MKFVFFHFFFNLQRQFPGRRQNQATGTIAIFTGPEQISIKPIIIFNSNKRNRIQKFLFRGKEAIITTLQQ